MITKETVTAFTRSWIEAFNAHSIERILWHYAEDVEFYSPFIKLLDFNSEGVIRSRADLRRYFEIGLRTYPDLFFELHHCLVGVNSFVVYYTSVKGKLAAETFRLNTEGKATHVCCHYAEAGN